jgi:hypothetical protein
VSAFRYVATAALRRRDERWELDGAIRVKRVELPIGGGTAFVLGGMFFTAQACGRSMKRDLREKFWIKGPMPVILDFQVKSR